MNGKQVVSGLKAAGWVLKRINGSHHMDNGSISVSVPVHGSKDAKPGTLASIERVTGIKLK
ncbi:MAG: type II toxin-antitoxin system HicA family toxin [Zoogloeaceae bacterium]|jgi:predicted RNA binding protein YcfA (HicA-like mRNA interferase family)|nr:type II toxin-antitoxin system HicA family toxin [Zoogloeaceae bacterium]